MINVWQNAMLGTKYNWATGPPPETNSPPALASIGVPQIYSHSILRLTWIHYCPVNGIIFISLPQLWVSPLIIVMVQPTRYRVWVLILHHYVLSIQSGYATCIWLTYKSLEHHFRRRNNKYIHIAIKFSIQADYSTTLPFYYFRRTSFRHLIDAERFRVLCIICWFSIVMRV